MDTTGLMAVVAGFQGIYTSGVARQIKNNNPIFDRIFHAVSNQVRYHFLPDLHIRQTHLFLLFHPINFT